MTALKSLIERCGNFIFAFNGNHGPFLHDFRILQTGDYRLIVPRGIGRIDKDDIEQNTISLKVVNHLAIVAKMDFDIIFFFERLNIFADDFYRFTMMIRKVYFIRSARDRKSVV
jgi:hypothetical protein